MMKKLLMAATLAAACIMPAVARDTVVKKLGEDVANEKTNGFDKNADTGCKYVALSALIALQKGAERAGANAVVDIVSYYKKETSISPTEIEGHDGTFVSAVALKGTFAKVAP